MSFDLKKFYVSNDIGTMLTYLKDTTYEMLVGITGLSGGLDTKKEKYDVFELHHDIVTKIAGRDTGSEITFDFFASNENLKRLESLKDKTKFIFIVGDSAYFELEGTMEFSIDSLGEVVKGKITLNVTKKEMKTSMNDLETKLEETTKELYKAVVK